MENKDIKEIRNTINKLKINKNLLAEKMKMPKGTFNNKLSAKHPTKFIDKELKSLKGIINELINVLVLKNEYGEKITVKIEGDNVLVHHTDITDSFIPLSQLFIKHILNSSEVIMIYTAVQAISVKKIINKL